MLRRSSSKKGAVPDEASTKPQHSSSAVNIALDTAATSRSSTERRSYEEPPPSASSSHASFGYAAYTPLSPRAAEDALVDLAHPYTGVLDLQSGRKADGLSFQPCAAARCQDRYIIEQFTVKGATGDVGSGKGEALWTLTGVFDGEYVIRRLWLCKISSTLLLGGFDIAVPRSVPLCLHSILGHAP